MSQTKIKVWSAALAAILLAALPCQSAAQDGVSTASAARARYLSDLGLIPHSSEIAVEDFINYHRHEIGRPRAGEAVGLDLRWTSDVASEGSAFLQVGLSTGLLNDRQDRRPVNLALVIDKSGSMKETNKMTRVKAALETLLSRLDEKDVLSIVVYDSDAEVLLPAERLTNKDTVRNAIKKIKPGGYTNIEAGLTLGYKEALKNHQKDATNRVILLTDGITNRGVIEPKEIADISVVYNDKGIDLSTIGVGQDLNHGLLNTLAKSGRGLFHFVANSDDIEKVFDKEIQSLLSQVALEPELEIEFPRGAEIENIYGFDPKGKGGIVSIQLDSMNSGMTEVVLVKFRNRSERAKVKVKITYYDIALEKQVTKTEDISISFDDRVQEDSLVRKNASIATLAQAIRDMAVFCEEDKPLDAERTINAAVTETRSSYPNLEDEDVERTLRIAEQYQSVLRKRNGHQVVVQAETNLIANGDFSQGSLGFSIAGEYIAPAPNCLWGGYYTIAPRFNEPQLHRLIPRKEYAAPKRPQGNEKVFFANVGGTGMHTILLTTVKCKPNTSYRISFQIASLSKGRGWIPTYEIRIGGERSEPQPAGYDAYKEISMIWNSGSLTTATMSISRMPIPHGGGLIAIANIEMIENNWGS